MTIRCLIVDDEAPARREMRNLLSAWPNLSIIGEAADCETALELTTRHEPDLVFLDIQLAGETGFDYMARLAPPEPRVIFVTAHDRYAIRAFECHALDYLLKPVHPDRLALAIERLEPASLRRAESEDFVFLKAPAFARLVPWRDVRMIVSEGNYTRVHLEDDTAPVLPRPLKHWLALMPKDLFFQVHRTTLVRLDAIREVHTDGDRHDLILNNGNRVTVGRTHWPALKEVLQRH